VKSLQLFLACSPLKLLKSARSSTDSRIGELEFELESAELESESGHKRGIKQEGGVLAKAGDQARWRMRTCFSMLPNCKRPLPQGAQTDEFRA
jgi:hypothetical protein